MKNLPALISGLAIGATLMYIFDPERGNRRRALIRDKAVGLTNDAQEAISGKAEDLSNRAKGLLHETKETLHKTKEALTGEENRNQQDTGEQKTHSQTA